MDLWRSENFSVRGNYIELHCTDAIPPNLPHAERDRIVDPDGTVNYMHQCTGEDPHLALWKKKIGTFLAEVVLGIPEVKGRRKFVLSSLPRGYALFMHKKGDRFDPRNDAYLWGSAKGMVFRSPAEFFFHAKWLLLGCPKPANNQHDPDEELFGPTPYDELTDRCGCKYCHGTNQTMISRKYSNYHPAKKNKTEATSGSVNVRFEGVHP